MSTVPAFLTEILRCPACGASDWRVQPLAGGASRVACAACGHGHRHERGVLWMDLPDEHDDVQRERAAVKPTEARPELGGWKETYAGVDATDAALKQAYLSLPYGDGSARFREPGYFANVNRFAEEFDLIAGQLPARGRLLDIGADGTWSTARLAARGLTCVALDITDHLVLGDLYQTVVPPYARVNVDMHAPVFVDEAFDVVTAFNALHHSSRLDAVVGRIAAVLKPGGTLAFVEPYIQNEAQAAEFGAPQSAVGINENVHSLAAWHEVFERAGFSLVSFAATDSFNAVYRKTGAAAGSGILATDRDGCIVRFYQAALSATAPPLPIAAGGTVALDVTVRNDSVAAWASRGPYPVTLGYHLSRIEDGVSREIAFDNPRTSIERFLRPGESRTFQVTVPLPEPGTYEVEFDLVHEARTWFKDRGSRTASVRCSAR